MRFEDVKLEVQRGCVLDDNASIEIKINSWAEWEHQEGAIAAELVRRWNAHDQLLAMANLYALNYCQTNCEICLGEIVGELDRAHDEKCKRMTAFLQSLEKEAGNGG